MSLRIIMVMPKETLTKLPAIRKEYKLQMNVFNNVSLKNIIGNKYIFIEPKDKNADDSLTGIGCYPFLNCDASTVGLSDKSTNFLKKELKKRKQNYMNDVSMWIRILKGLQSKFMIEETGIFYFCADDFSENVNFKKLEKIYIDVNDLKNSDLITLPMDTVIFVRKSN